MYCSAVANKSISDSLLNSETQASCYHLKRTHFKSSSFGLDRSVLRFLPMCIIILQVSFTTITLLVCDIVH